VTRRRGAVTRAPCFSWAPLPAGVRVDEVVQVTAAVSAAGHVVRRLDLGHPVDQLAAPDAVDHRVGAYARQRGVIRGGTEGQVRGVLVLGHAGAAVVQRDGVRAEPVAYGAEEDGVQPPPVDGVLRVAVAARLLGSR
jgi:hypothetical protein